MKYKPMALSNKLGRINWKRAGAEGGVGWDGGGGLSSSLPGGAEPSKLLYPGSTGKEGGASLARIWTGAPVCSSPFLRTKKPGLKEKQMRRLSHLKGSFQSPAIGRKGLGSFPNTSYL